MSKSQSIVVLILLVMLLAFVGFLSWQLSTLRTEFDAVRDKNQGQALNSTEFEKEIAALKTKQAEQGSMLQEFAAQMANLSNTLKEDLRKEFVPHPEYVSSQPLFISHKIDDNNFQVSGDLASLDSWEEKNKFFLDYILQDSLILDFDNAKQKIVVSDILPDGLYYQMGLRKGDVVQSIDGRAFYNVDDFRVRLLDRIPTKVLLTRGDQNVTLDISYAANNPNQVSLDLTRSEFDTVLPDLLKTLHLAPVVENGQNQGVKIVSMEPTNVFSLMNFEPQDVITQVNSTPVTLESFITTVQSAKAPLSFDFTRAGVAKNIIVMFAD